MIIPGSHVYLDPNLPADEREREGLPLPNNRVGQNGSQSFRPQSDRRKY